MEEIFRKNNLSEYKWKKIKLYKKTKHIIITRKMKHIFFLRKFECTHIKYKKKDTCKFLG